MYSIALQTCIAVKWAPGPMNTTIPIIAVAPAIGNAVFNATGVRIRSMPMRGEVLKQA
jgi:hypothetical protein